MSLQLTLPPQLEERLKQEAARRGLSADACAIQTLDQHLPPVNRATRLQVLFDQWTAEDQAAARSPLSSGSGAGGARKRTKSFNRSRSV